MNIGGEKMHKRSIGIGSLMLKKLSDITNSHSLLQHKLETFPTNHDSIQQLLKERATLMQLLAEKDEMIELNGAELQGVRADIKKLQLQNWNLAQSNSHMLAELNLGREKIKMLQHEISLRTALLKGNTANLQEKVEMDCEKNASLSQPQLKEGDENAWQPSSTNDSNDEQHSYMNRRCIRSRSTGSSTASKKNASKDNRRRVRRHSTTCTRHEAEPSENLFEIEDANYLVTESGPNMLSSAAVKDETGESFGLRNETPRSSFGRPVRRAAEKVHSYKEIPLNVKMRRLE